MPRFVVALLLLSHCGNSAAEEADPRIRHGVAIAEQLCAECHAIGNEEQSPHAHAPPFRRIEQRVDLDSFMTRLREGLTSGHPDMPTFRFSRDDARALIAYLRAIQQR
jgi:mono/diheme cytochrome c family protein